MQVSDIELAELARLHGTPWATVAQECITARERGPVLEAECKRLYEENLNLRSRLHDYVDMQAKMFDECRVMRADLEILRQALANRDA